MNIRLEVWLLVETVVFFLAALMHAGIILSGHQHGQAEIAEATITFVLLAGLFLSMAVPRYARTFAISMQSFALFCVGIGIFMIAIGIGPQSTLDYVLHAVMVLMLGSGIWYAVRARQGPAVLRPV